MKMENVIAITVTYNDAKYLEKCIKGLYSQTYKLNKIIIVDNNSNKENKQRINSFLGDNIEVLSLTENFGGAGGFEKGMKYARDKYDPDWYWLMDADAYPENNCLEKLLLCKNSFKNVGILAPLIYGVDLHEYQLYHHKKVVSFLARDISIYKCYEDIPELSLIEADAFVGPLVSKSAVCNLGIANGSFFIYGDDLEYTYRISRKFPVVLVKNAIINHRDQPVKGVQTPYNWWKDYYMYRNRIVFIKKYATNSVFGLIGICYVLLRCIKQYLLSFYMPYERKLKKLRRKLLLRSLHDGLYGKLGKTIDPQMFRNGVEEYE